MVVARVWQLADLPVPLGAVCGRDPPDAEQEARYSIWVRDLKPNTSYTFRMRAFNGFGAGGWAHGVFTTR